MNLDEALAEAREYLGGCENLFDSRDLTEAVQWGGTITLGALRVLTEAAALGEDNWNLATERQRREQVDREFEVTGRDTVMYCLAHKRKIRWLPAPGWWIHDDHGRLAGNPTDPRGCLAMWDAPAPIIITRKAEL